RAADATLLGHVGRHPAPEALAVARGRGPRRRRLPREPRDPRRGRRPAPRRERRRHREARRAPGREPALRPDRHAARRAALELRLLAPDEPDARPARGLRRALRPPPRPVVVDQVLDGLALDLALPAHNGVTRFDHVIPEEATLPAELFKQAGFRTVG